MGRLDELDLSRKLGRKQEDEGLEQAWGRLQQLRLTLGGQIGDKVIGPFLGVGELAAGDYEIVKPGGAFYVFPRAPWGTASEFVAKAIENELLIIPGNIFSHQDTHFRLSYAADDATIDRGIEVLKKLARKP